MKNFKILAVTIGALALFGTNNTNAQDQMYWVSKDNVKPSMQAEYEKTALELVAACKTHSLPDITFNCWRYDDGSYVYASPLKNFADMDKDVMKPLRDKMGADKFKALFERFDKCYDSNHTFMATFMSDLSYLNDGKVNEGDYRKVHFMYVTPSNSKVVAAKLKEIRELFATKESKIYFAVMHSGLGASEEYYAVLVNAKDAGEYYKMGTENNKLLGAEWAKKWGELYALLARYEAETSTYRADLSYQAK